MIVSAHASVVLCKSFDMNTVIRLKVNKNTLFMKRTYWVTSRYRIFLIESDDPRTVHPSIHGVYPFKIENSEQNRGRKIYLLW